MKAYIPAIAVLGMALAAGCTDETPTGTGSGVIPGAPRSVEVYLPFSEVATDLRQYSGFGSVATLGEGWIARGFEGDFTSHILARFPPPPDRIQATDEFGTSRTDSMFTVIGGDVTVRFDTVGVGADAFEVQARTPTVPWDPGSANWTMALDTAGRMVPWPEPGGAGGEILDSELWAPPGSDSVTLVLDSAAVAPWVDGVDETRGVQVELVDPGLRFRVTGVEARIRIRPSFNESAEVTASLGDGLYTFIYSPMTEADPDDLIFGGAPSWRSTFRFTLPETLDGPTELCEIFGCPVELMPGMVSSASLVLTSRATPEYYRTADTLQLEIRPVLQPDLLPKSPLGAPVIRTSGSGASIPAFTGVGGLRVDVPVTSYIRSLVDGVGKGQEGFSSTVTFHTGREPASLTYARFEGPGSANPPRLRLILTTSDPVELP